MSRQSGRNRPNDPFDNRISHHKRTIRARREVSDMRKAFVSALFLLASFMTASSAEAHCEMPCGIYRDQLRFSLMREDADTIEKAMKQIVDLANVKKLRTFIS